jgi:hypothetical protein
MMAKMFYTLDETRSALGKNEEEIKQYAREGRLREFRDGPRLMFKADQVEALKNELGLGGGGGGGASAAPDIGPSDSGGPIGLVDSRGGSASGISLVDTDLSGRGGSGAGMQLKDDTALAGDTGLSGTGGGMPSPQRTGSSSSGNLGGSRAGASGINVLGDSVAPADPMAQTAISGGGISDQISLEGTGSGSGLLDLTRESDDTSLGAELLDEIAPGGSKRGTKAGTKGGSSVSGSSGSLSSAGSSVGGTAVAAPAIGGRGAKVTEVVYREAEDSWAPLLGGLSVGAAVVVLFAGLALMSGVLDTRPPLLQTFKDMKFPILACISLGVALVGGAAGAVLGKVMK